MEKLAAHEITVMFLGLGILLAVAKTFGALARRANQPEVLGELVAGVFLGPTILGAGAPEWSVSLFPRQGISAVVLDSVTTLGVALFLLMAGMEVDLRAVRRRGRAAFAVSVAGIVIPGTLGFTAAWLAPEFFHRKPAIDLVVFALFLGTALSISALPVIAKTLMDMRLYHTDLGRIVIAAAFFNDLAGWLIFSTVLVLVGTVPAHGWGLQGTIVGTMAFAIVVLTVGRGLVDRALGRLQRQQTSSWHGGGPLAFVLTLAMFGAAFTEWIGIHAVLGTFLVGVAIGDSRHLHEHTRAAIKHFVSSFFAPMFFASIGLKLNYAAHFDLSLTLVVLLLACAGKILGCWIGARCSRLPSSAAWGIAFGMNARGAMEIIFGLLALNHGLITESMFVALVVVAFATSMMSGPLIRWSLSVRRVEDLAAPREAREDRRWTSPVAAMDGNGHDPAPIPQQAAPAR